MRAVLEPRQVNMSRLFVGWFQEQRIWNCSWEDSDHVINFPDTNGRQSFPARTLAVRGGDND